MNRTTRSLKLTEEGEAFLRQSRVALEALDLAVNSVNSQHAAPRGSVRISTSAGFGREQLAPVLPGLLQKYPGLAVEVDFDDRLTDLIHDGYDIALRGGRVADSSLVARTVCQFRMVLVVSPAYLASNGVPRQPDELIKHRLLTRRFLGGRISPWNFLAADESFTTLNTESAVMTMSSPETLTQMAVAGAGIAEVGVHHAWKYLRKGELQLIF